jgi:hypothetical protein
MQLKESRKESIRKFKEQKTPLGAYAVRCTVTGRVWVGVSRNLNATHNGCWFILRSGSHYDKSLQEDWNTHGESAFAYEILETLDDDIHPMALDSILKDKKLEWVTRLNAVPLR